MDMAFRAWVLPAVAHNSMHTPAHSALPTWRRRLAAAAPGRRRNALVPGHAAQAPSLAVAGFPTTTALYGCVGPAIFRVADRLSAEQIAGRGVIMMGGVPTSCQPGQAGIW